MTAFENEQNYVNNTEQDTCLVLCLTEQILSY
jgi:hypothetical protein